MTGRVEPSDEELRSNIKKRMYLLHLPASLAHKKRYFPEFSPKVNTGSGISNAVVGTKYVLCRPVHVYEFLPTYLQ